MTPHSTTTTQKRPSNPQDGNAMALFFNLTRDTKQSDALSEALTTNWNRFGPVTPELPDVISPFISGVEALGHFAAGQPRRALDLARRLWGHLLDAPEMTGSTLAEGLAANGSLYYRGASGYNYDAAYTRMSHGWSKGPLVALTTRLGGLEALGLVQVGLCAAAGRRGAGGAERVSDPLWPV